jgi:hypothetical protein
LHPSFTLSRRRFLQALPAIGATVSLLGSKEDASASAIDTASTMALENPWNLEVGEWDAIIEPGVREPTVRADVFDLWHRQPRDPEHPISAVAEVMPLAEGDRTGSDYIAEKLRQPIAEANQAAAELGLPFRFRDAEANA